MKRVVVKVFDGITIQIPNYYSVISDTYQGIIKELILYGLKSGKLYDIKGNEINLIASPTEQEILQYIMFTGEIILSETIIVGTMLNPKYIPYNEHMIVQDICNYLISFYNYRPGFYITYGRNTLNLNDKLPKAKLPVGATKLLLPKDIPKINNNLIEKSNYVLDVIYL